MKTITGLLLLLVTVNAPAQQCDLAALNSLQRQRNMLMSIVTAKDPAASFYQEVQRLEGELEAMTQSATEANIRAAEARDALTDALVERDAALEQCSGEADGLVGVTEKIHAIYEFTQFRRQELLDEIFRLVQLNGTVAAEATRLVELNRQIAHDRDVCLTGQ